MNNPKELRELADLVEWLRTVSGKSPTRSVWFDMEDEETLLINVYEHDSGPMDVQIRVSAAYDEDPHLAIRVSDSRGTEHRNIGYREWRP